MLVLFALPLLLVKGATCSIIKVTLPLTLDTTRHSMNLRRVEPSEVMIKYRKQFMLMPCVPYQGFCEGGLFSGIRVVALSM